MKVKLGDISQIITGPFGSQLHMSDYVSDGYPVIMPQNISNRRVNEIGIARIDDSNFNRLIRYSVQPNDIIYARRGKVDEHAFIDVPQKMICGTGCFRVRVVSREVYPLFLSLYLNRAETRQWLISHAVGSNMPNLNTDILSNVPLELPEYSEQVRIAQCLQSIDDKIRINDAINDNLTQMLRLLYEQWFYRFEFPNEQKLPYNRANGELEWNDKLKRRIPKGWKVQTMLSNELFSVISSGVDRFSTKKYYATADIIGSSIGEGSDIEYETRESRANMQPVINSVWFAKMKNSIKHLFLNKEMSSFVDNSILSTGFYGLKCNEISFEYIASVVSAPIFEITKDRLSHGATQQGIGDDDMANITLLIPDDTTLRKYHEATKGFFAKISNNILENKRLIAIRNFLLPLLMNGQATIAE